MNVKTLYLILIFLSLNVLAFCQTKQGWSLVTEHANFSPRDCGGTYNKGLAFDGKIWISGGYNWEYMDVVPDQWCSSDGVHWTQVISMSDIYGLNLVYDNKLWQTSHYDLSSKDGIKWYDHGKSPEDGYTVIFNNKIWLIGTSAIYSTDNFIGWNLEKGSLPWSKRTYFGVIVFNDRLWVIGGINYPNLDETYNDVWSSSDGINWIQNTSAAAWSPRRFFTPVEYKGKMWVICGQDKSFPNGVNSGNLNEVWYSSDGANWYKFNSAVSLPPRHAPYTLTFDNSIYVIGGYANNDLSYNDVWKLNINKLTITSEPITAAELNSPYSYYVHADFSVDNDTVKYRLVNSPLWMSIDSKSGLISGSPSSCSSTDSEVEVEAYTSGGESDMQTFNVRILKNQINALISSSGPVSFCKGGNTVLSPFLNYSEYKWSNGDTSKEITVSKSGEYFVIIKDENGCYDSSNVITVNTLPNVSIAANSNNYVCSGDSLRLSATDDFADYLWSTGDKTKSIFVKNAEDYFLIVKDINGCTDTSNIITLKVKSLPAPTITFSDSLCAGKDNFLTTESYHNYLWSDGETTKVIDVDKEGSYSVSVIDYHGCRNQSQSVYVYPMPYVSIIPESSATFCAGDSVILSSVYSFPSYLWNSEDKTPSITAKSTGDYYLTATDNRGCKGVSNKVHINVNQLPVPVLNYQSLVKKCMNDTVVLRTNQNYDSYSWSSGSNGEYSELSASGYYYVTVRDENGCSGTSDSVYVEFYPVPKADFSFDTADQEISFSNLSTGSDSYIWNFGDNTESQEISPDHYYSDFDTYNVILISSNRICSDTISKSIKISFENLIIYPNPVSDILKIKLNDIRSIDFELYLTDIKGSKIFHRKLDKGDSLIEIDLSKFKNGLYILSLEYQNKPFLTKRIIKTGTGQ